MAILDARLEMSDAQTLTSVGSGSTNASAYYIDFGANGKDGWGNAKTPNVGEGMRLVWNVEATAAMVGAGTVTAALYTHTGTTPASGTKIAELAFAAASPAGTRKAVMVPTGTIQRYMGVVYTIGGGGITSGSFGSWINLDHDTQLV
jgi:hypothetical protein